MRSVRPIALLTAVAGLALAAPAPATEHFGGAPAQIFLEEEGGGVVAPDAPAPESRPSGEATAPPPVDAEAAQEPTPTTPEGEEQPPDETPDEDEDTENGGMGPVEELPEDGAPNGEAGSGGFLPHSGFALAALTAIGLGLLMAGAALWPTSSWPPARGRRQPPRRPAPRR